jgi:hypothetical protein
MRLLVLLGAGSSCAQVTPGDKHGARLPLVDELNSEVLKWARQYATVTNTPDYFARLWQQRTDYNQKDPLLRTGDAVNFEQVLGDSYALWNGLRGAPFGDPVFSKAAEALGFKDDEASFYNAGEQIRHILSAIALRFRESSQSFEAGADQSPVFGSYRKLLGGLGRSFDLGIYNLNYDTVAYKGRPGLLFTGFDEMGNFQPGDVHDREQWNFIYHLHGSVHFSYPEVPVDRIVWKDSLVDDFIDSMEVPTEGPDRRVRIASTVITGGWKLEQLQEEPFQTYYSSFRRHAYQADAIVIGGYGFGDSHINSVITNAIAHRRRKVPVLIIDKAEMDGAPKLGQVVVPGRTASPWERAQSTLRFTGLNKPGPIAVPYFPGFEFLDDYRAPTALWTGGFETASSVSEAMVRWLRLGSFQ